MTRLPPRVLSKGREPVFSLGWRAFKPYNVSMCSRKFLKHNFGSVPCVAKDGSTSRTNDKGRTYDLEHLRLQAAKIASENTRIRELIKGLRGKSRKFQKEQALYEKELRDAQQSELNLRDVREGQQNRDEPCGVSSAELVLKVENTKSESQSPAIAERGSVKNVELHRKQGLTVGSESSEKNEDSLSNEELGMESGLAENEVPNCRGLSSDPETTFMPSSFQSSLSPNAEAMTSCLGTPERQRSAWSSLRSEVRRVHDKASSASAPPTGPNFRSEGQTVQAGRGAPGDASRSYGHRVLDPERGGSGETASARNVGRSRESVLAEKRSDKGARGAPHGWGESKGPVMGKNEAGVAIREPLSIVFVSAEVTPWSKTGGLADVVGALPKALAARGHRVMVVAPRYINSETEECYKDAKETGISKAIDMMQGGVHHVQYYHLHRDEVDWVFVDHISYHRTGTPYGGPDGPFADNLFRFALLSMAAIEAPLVLNIGGLRFDGIPGEPYGQKCLFVANDWHASLVSVYLGARFRPHNTHKDSRCVLALHNVAHQGSYPPSAFSSLGLSEDWYGTLEWVFHVPSLLDERSLSLHSINCLKAALVTADRAITVSQNYAKEICDVEAYGYGLSSLLQHRSDKLRGILNGFDGMEWNPATDKHLTYNYDVETLNDKVHCKVALQRQVGLPPEFERPLLCFIGRLDYQKGPDLVLKAIPYFVNRGCQVVILGNGAFDYEEQMQEVEAKHPYFVRALTKFDVPLSHRMIAGSDILLMPSRFEPCGLNQLHAMRYGTIPVVHSTGGLRDSVDDYNIFAPSGHQSGTGWTFFPATLNNFVEAVEEAVQVFKTMPKEWYSMQIRCMQQHDGWDRAAKQYETVFEAVMTESQETWVSKRAKGAAAMRSHTALAQTHA